MLAEVVMMAAPFHLVYDLVLGIEPLFVRSMVACGAAEKCPYARSKALVMMMGEEVS
jgi:hypothetical protein